MTEDDLSQGFTKAQNGEELPNEFQVRTALNQLIPYAHITILLKQDEPGMAEHHSLAHTLPDIINNLYPSPKATLNPMIKIKGGTMGIGIGLGKETSLSTIVENMIPRYSDIPSVNKALETIAPLIGNEQWREHVHTKNNQEQLDKKRGALLMKVHTNKEDPVSVWHSQDAQTNEQHADRELAIRDVKNGNPDHPASTVSHLHK